MTKLQEYLAKKNQPNEDGLKTFIGKAVNKFLTDNFEVLKKELTDQLISDVQKEIKIMTTKTYKGEKGEDGYTPIKGVDYFDGKDGRDGKDGLNGTDGRDGKDGLDGMDGSPDMPQQIADKLNTLEDKLDIKVIRGLNNILKNIQASLREKSSRSFGGGGMGNVQHESTAVSSATTTLTTTYDIAGNGYAIWAYYQGQLIMRGTHYTVSGKTLTLTFTPADSTTIDIIYIRS